MSLFDEVKRYLGIGEFVKRRYNSNYTEDEARSVSRIAYVPIALVEAGQRVCEEEREGFK